MRMKNAVKWLNVFYFLLPKIEVTMNPLFKSTESEVALLKPIKMI